MYALEVKGLQFFEMSEPFIQQHSITSLKCETLFDLSQACTTQKSVSAILLHRKQLWAAGVDSWGWGSYVIIFYLNNLIMFIYNYESWKKQRKCSTRKKKFAFPFTSQTSEILQLFQQQAYQNWG